MVIPRVRQSRYIVRGGLVAMVVAVSVWGAVRHSTSSPTTLRSVAQQFNVNYAANKDGPVWDDFDVASQRVISRASYIHWHQVCPAPRVASTITSVTKASNGFWRVAYRESGVTLIDYWHQQDGKWRFDLAKSNPTSVALYSGTLAKYLLGRWCHP